MLEGPYKTRLIKRLRRLFPGCIILKNDADYQQGIPDLTILWGPYWAFLEVKPKEPKSADDFVPNQEWFVAEADRMSFGAVIYPENEEEVLNDLQQAFRAR